MTLLLAMTMWLIPRVAHGATNAKSSIEADQAEKEKAEENAIEKAVEKAVEKIAEKAAEQTVEKVAEKAVEKAAEKAAEETAEKAELKTKRPAEWRGPTKVDFFLFVLDIDNIDGAAQSFSVNVYIRLGWKDERLAHEGGVKTIPLTEVWNPHLLIANRGGIVLKSLPDVVEVEPDGTVAYQQRYTGPLSQPLKLSEFPFDQHQFTIQFIAPGYAPKDLQFVPAPAISEPQIIGGAMYETLSLPDWKVTEYMAEARPYRPVGNIEVAGFVFEFTAKRYPLYYIWQVIVPLILIVMMSWGAFWIDPTHAGAQIGVATSSMLTLIAYRFMLGNLIPRLPYMTRLDYFTLGSTILVFLTLLEVVVTTNLALRKRANLSRKVDRWCRVIFPLVFVFGSVRSLIW